ncbi:UDP-glycosyltransferase 71A15 [Arachis duranensis]|uniref:Glycosyltransferase n=1 Tax=Arachis duranensis TaxID=130453 RepID=A0A6P4DVI2_ARADU|nr:UDP-glycosyltransferase 71A15 [Arachis duranensis]
MSNKKAAQVVLVPSPGQGHLLSTLQFAKLLVNHDHRLTVNIMLFKSPVDSKTTSTATNSLHSESHRINVINLPDYTPKPPSSDSERASSMDALIDFMKPHVREAVTKLTGSPSAPPLAAFVLDMFFTSMIEIAKDFRVPALVFFTSGATFFGMTLHMHTLRVRDNLVAYEWEDSDSELTIPTFANPFPWRNMPTFLTRKQWDPIFMSYASGLKEADATSSVVFLCFGSRGWFHQEQVREIARALEDSGARFLWSLRKPPPEDSFMGAPSDYSLPELTELLPHGFLDRTAEVGRVIGWAPQAQILAHKATGGFVSHCGWNSTLESIYYGVPIAAWPLYAEQQSNAFQLVRELKLGVEISLEFKHELMFGTTRVLSAEKIEKGIRNLLTDAEVRKRMKEMSEKSRSTMKEGGCSYSHLGRLIDYLMDKVSV